MIYSANKHIATLTIKIEIRVQIKSKLDVIDAYKPSGENRGVYWGFHCFAFCWVNNKHFSCNFYIFLTLSNIEIFCLYTKQN